MAVHPFWRFIESIAARVVKLHFFGVLDFLLLLPVKLGFLMVLARTCSQMVCLPAGLWV